MYQEFVNVHSTVVSLLSMGCEEDDDANITIVRPAARPATSDKNLHKTKPNVKYPHIAVLF